MTMKNAKSFAALSLVADFFAFLEGTPTSVVSIRPPAFDCAQVPGGHVVIRSLVQKPRRSPSARRRRVYRGAGGIEPTNKRTNQRASTGLTFFHPIISTNASIRVRVCCERGSPISNSTYVTGMPSASNFFRINGTSKSSGSQNLGS